MTPAKVAVHTPIGWEQDGQTVRSPRGIIAVCPTPQNGGTFDCADNARLIAAAPDLLAACEEKLAADNDHASHQHPPVAVVRRRADADAELRRVIAAARGAK